MSSHYADHPRPKWWQVYLTLPLLVALFAVDSRLKISTRGHQAVQIGIVVIIYGLIHFWLKANASALSQMDREHYQKRIKVFRVPVSQLPESNGENSPKFQIPVSEIKGVLSDTFEMDIIDAEFLPANEVEVTQDLKKE